MIRILIVCNSLEFLISHRLEFVKKISTICEVSVLGDGSRLAGDKLKSHGIKIFYSDSARNYSSIITSGIFFNEIKTKVRDLEVETIIPIGIKSCVFCSLFGLSILGSKKIIAIFPGLGRIFSSRRFFIARFLLRFFFTVTLGQRNLFSVFQTFSDYRSLILCKTKSHNKPLFVRGSGINLEHFRSQSRSRSMNRKTIKIGYIGRFIEEKGILDFLALSEKLSKSSEQSFEFLFAGKLTSQSSKRVIARVNEVESNGTAEWLGFINNPQDFFGKIDVLVYPATYGDGVPKVLLEACAAGCYAVAYRSPGVEVAISNHRTGLILDEFSVRALEKGIRLFASLSGDERAAIVRNCLGRAEALFSEADVIDKLIRYIRSTERVERDSLQW